MKTKYEVPTVKSIANMIIVATIPAMPFLLIFMLRSHRLRVRHDIPVESSDHDSVGRARDESLAEGRAVRQRGRNGQSVELRVRSLHRRPRDRWGFVRSCGSLAL